MLIKTIDLMRIVILALLLTVPVAADAAEPSLTQEKGRIEYHSYDGKTATLVTGTDFQSPSLSPDGRSVAFIHALKPQNEDREGLAELWIGDGPTGRTHRIIGPRHSSDPKSDMDWFDRPTFSLDGKFVYVNADAWATGAAVHRVDIATGKERFVTDGNLNGIMRTGPYQGDLIVSRHTPWMSPKIGYHYPLYLVRPNGTTRMRVPDMDDDDDRAHLTAWLTGKGWMAW